MFHPPLAAPLPISVIVPTRDSMDKLPRHLELHAPIFAQCAEIIHCDSFSKDETKGYLAATIIHPRLRQLDHPPGLYQSWNYAIQHTTQDYVYISTVGDAIEPSALAEMLDLAKRHDADLVVSPPSFFDESGRAKDIRWPIHHLIAHQKITNPALVPSALVLTEAILHAPDGILGSLAGCLYRGSFLRAHPFPLGYHGACDSAWAVRHVAKARCVVLPRSVSKFLIHEKSYESHGLINAEIAILVRTLARHELNQLRPTTQDPARPGYPLFSKEALRALRRYNLAALLQARFTLKLTKYRINSHGRWVFNPFVWITRNRRNRKRALAHRLAEKLNSCLLSSQPTSR